MVGKRERDRERERVKGKEKKGEQTEEKGIANLQPNTETHTKTPFAKRANKALTSPVLKLNSFRSINSLQLPVDLALQTK